MESFAASVVTNLNHSNNFAVERDLCDVPTLQKFKIIDVYRDMTKEDRLALFLVLDGREVDFDDDLGDNFIISLYHPFNSETLYLELKELVVKMRLRGDVFIELLEIRGNEEPFVPIVKFTYKLAIETPTTGGGNDSDPHPIQKYAELHCSEVIVLSD